MWNVWALEHPTELSQLHRKVTLTWKHTISSTTLIQFYNWTVSTWRWCCSWAVRSRITVSFSAFKNVTTPGKWIWEINQNFQSFFFHKCRFLMITMTTYKLRHWNNQMKKERDFFYQFALALPFLGVLNSQCLGVRLLLNWRKAISWILSQVKLLFWRPDWFVLELTNRQSRADLLLWRFIPTTNQLTDSDLTCLLPASVFFSQSRGGFCSVKDFDDMAATSQAR